MDWFEDDHDMADELHPAVSGLPEALGITIPLGIPTEGSSTPSEYSQDELEDLKGERLSAPSGNLVAAAVGASEALDVGDETPDGALGNTPGSTLGTAPAVTPSATSQTPLEESTIGASNALGVSDDTPDATPDATHQTLLDEAERANHSRISSSGGRPDSKHRQKNSKVGTPRAGNAKDLCFSVEGFGVSGTHSEEADNTAHLRSPPSLNFKGGSPKASSAKDVCFSVEGLGVSGNHSEEADNTENLRSPPAPNFKGGSLRASSAKDLSFSVDGFGVSGNHSEEVDDTANLRSPPAPNFKGGSLRVSTAKDLCFSVEGFGVSGNHSEEADDNAHVSLASPSSLNIKSPRVAKAQLMQAKAPSQAPRSTANRPAGRLKNLGSVMSVQRRTKEFTEVLQAGISGKAASRNVKVITPEEHQDLEQRKAKPGGTDEEPATSAPKPVEPPADEEKPGPNLGRPSTPRLLVDQLQVPQTSEEVAQSEAFGRLENRLDEAANDMEAVDSEGAKVQSSRDNEEEFKREEPLQSSTDVGEISGEERFTKAHKGVDEQVSEQSVTNIDPSVDSQSFTGEQVIEQSGKCVEPSLDSQNGTGEQVIEQSGKSAEPSLDYLRDFGEQVIDQTGKNIEPPLGSQSDFGEQVIEQVGKEVEQSLDSQRGVGEQVIDQASKNIEPPLDSQSDLGEQVIEQAGENIEPPLDSQSDFGEQVIEQAGKEVEPSLDSQSSVGEQVIEQTSKEVEPSLTTMSKSSSQRSCEGESTESPVSTASRTSNRKSTRISILKKTATSKAWSRVRKCFGNIRRVSSIDELIDEEPKDEQPIRKKAAAPNSSTKMRKSLDKSKTTGFDDELKKEEAPWSPTRHTQRLRGCRTQGDLTAEAKDEPRRSSMDELHSEPRDFQETFSKQVSAESKELVSDTDQSEPASPSSSRSERKNRTLGALKIKSAVAKIKDRKTKKKITLMTLNTPGSSRIARRRSDDSASTAPPNRRNSDDGRQRRTSAGGSGRKTVVSTTSYTDGTRDDSTNLTKTSDKFRSFLQKRQLFSSARTKYENMEVSSGADRLKAAVFAVVEGVRKINIQQHIVDAFKMTHIEKQMRLKLSTMLQDTLQQQDDAMPLQLCIMHISKCFSKCQEELSNMKADQRGARFMLKTFQEQVQKAVQRVQRQKEAVEVLRETEMQLWKSFERAQEDPDMADVVWRKVWNANALLNRFKMSTKDLKDCFIEFGTPKVTMALLADAGLALSDVSSRRDSSNADFSSTSTRRFSSRKAEGQSVMARQESEEEDAHSLLKYLPEEGLRPLREELRAQGAGHVDTQVKCARALGRLGVLWKDLPRVVQAFCSEVWNEIVSRVIQMLSELNMQDSASLQAALREIEQQLDTQFPGSKPRLLKLSHHRTSGNLYAQPTEADEVNATDEQDATSPADADLSPERCRRGSIRPMVELKVTERVSTPGPSNQDDGDNDDQHSFASSSSDSDGEPEEDVTQQFADAKEYAQSRSLPDMSDDLMSRPLTQSRSLPDRRPSLQDPHADTHKLMRARAAEVLVSLTDHLGVGVLAMSKRKSGFECRRGSVGDELSTAAELKRRLSLGMDSPNMTAMKRRHSLDEGGPKAISLQKQRASFSFGSSPSSWSDGLRALYEKCSQDNDEGMLKRTGDPVIGQERRPSFMAQLAIQAKRLNEKYTTEATLEEGETGVTPSEQKQVRKKSLVGSRRPSLAATMGSRRPSLAETMGSRRPSLAATMGSRPGSRLQRIPRPGSCNSQISRPGSRNRDRSWPDSQNRQKTEESSIPPRLHGEWGSVKAQRQRAAGRTVAAWLGHLPNSRCLPEVKRPQTSGCDRKTGRVPPAKQPVFLVADSFITPAKSRFQAARYCSRPTTSGTSNRYGLPSEFPYSSSLVESDVSAIPKLSPSSRPGTSGSCGISRSKNRGAGDSVILFLPVLSGLGTGGRGSITPQPSRSGSSADW